MKTHLYVTFFLISYFFFLPTSCSDNSINETESVKASLPSGFITKNDLGPALKVNDAKANSLRSHELLIEGFIGGRKKPFTDNRAVFILGDDSLETCDEIPGDHCPTPWDACCEDRKKIASSIISIQVLDKNGSLVEGTLDGVSGLRAGCRVKVRGNISKKSTAQAFIINARQIQLMPN